MPYVRSDPNAREAAIFSKWLFGMYMEPYMVQMPASSHRSKFLISKDIMSIEVIPPAPQRMTSAAMRALRYMIFDTCGRK